MYLNNNNQIIIQNLLFIYKIVKKNHSIFKNVNINKF